MSDSKKIEKVIEKLKAKMNPNEEQLERLKKMAEKYDGKSEEDMIFEIMNFKKEMVDNMGEEEFEKKIKKLERIRPMLNEDQLEKLEKLLGILNKSK